MAEVTDLMIVKTIAGHFDSLASLRKRRSNWRGQK